MKGLACPQSVIGTVPVGERERGALGPLVSLGCAVWAEGSPWQRSDMVTVTRLLTFGGRTWRWWAAGGQAAPRQVLLRVFTEGVG